MANNTKIIFVALALWLIIIVKIVALATPYWIHMTYKDGSAYVTWNIGMFSVCVSTSALGGLSVCASYATNLGAGATHYVQIALLCIATVLYLASAIIASTKIRQGPTQRDYQQMCGCMIAGFIIDAAMIGWFGSGVASLNTALASVDSLHSKLNWSFFIACVCVGLAFFMTILMCVFRSSAPDVGTPGTVIMHNTQQPTVNVQYPNQGYPNQGYPNQGYGGSKY